MEKALKIISGELAEFEDHFRQAVKSNVSLLDRIMHYIVKRKGKQLRPMFVFLSARMGGDVSGVHDANAATTEYGDPDHSEVPPCASPQFLLH